MRRNNIKQKSYIEPNISKQVFVSKYYKSKPGEISSYLTRKKLVYREKDNVYIVQECPFCHPTHNKPDNQWKLNVFKSSGSYNCFRCGSKGSYFDLKSHLVILKVNLVVFIKHK